MVAWDYLKRYSDEIRAGSPHESELRVDLFNGSRVRLYGADNPDSLRGIGLDGCIVDEYAQCRVNLFGEVLRPALADKQGWVTFIGTPQGRVGLYDIWAGEKPWDKLDVFRLMLRIEDTGNDALPASEVEDLKRSLSPDEWEQEMECSFDAAIKGAVYGKVMSAAEKDGRICSVPYDPSALVHTGWDIGRRDPTAIWFAQSIGREVRLIDYYESSGIDVAHYAGVLREKNYNYGGHILPFDAAAKELTSNKSVQDVLDGLNVRPLTILSQHHISDGINAARLTIPTCVFDAKKCKRGIDALKLYRFEFDDKLNTLKNAPVHDWTSHGADAFRYLCEGLARGVNSKEFNRKLEYANMGIV